LGRLRFVTTKEVGLAGIYFEWQGILTWVDLLQVAEWRGGQGEIWGFE